MERLKFHFILLKGNNLELPTSNLEIWLATQSCIIGPWKISRVHAGVSVHLTGMSLTKLSINQDNDDHFVYYGLCKYEPGDRKMKLAANFPWCVFGNLSWIFFFRMSPHIQGFAKSASFCNDTWKQQKRMSILSWWTDLVNEKVHPKMLNFSYSNSNCNCWI